MYEIVLSNSLISKVIWSICGKSTHTEHMKKLITLFCIAIIAVSIILPLIYANNTAKAACDVALPILMYHSVLKSKNGTYIVSPSQLEADFKRIIAEGYAAVTSEQVINYVDGKGSLPDKPIMITFDDGHYNNIYYAKPLLEKYGLKAVFNVIGKFSDFTTNSGDVDNPNYSHATWDEIAELSNGSVMEIGNHTYNMHNYKPRFGIAQKYGESDEEYVAALKNDIGRLQKILFDCTGKHCRVLAYPFGKYGSLAEKTLIEMGFRMMFTCNEGVSYIKQGEPKSLYKLKRINRSGKYDVDTVMDKIKK